MIILQKYNPRQLDPDDIHRIKDRYTEYEERVILSTCQRLEIYYGSGTVKEEIVRHLFRLAAGLESVFTGDPSILGQLKQAYKSALEAKTLNKNLHRLFEHALYVGKKVRSTTGIAYGSVGYPQATVNILKNSLGDLSRFSGVIIGVNKLTDVILNILQKERVGNLLLVNRSAVHGMKLASKYGIDFVPIEDLKEAAARSHFLISCTSSENPVVYKDNLSGSISLLLDLGVPGNIDPSLKLLDSVELHAIDEIENSIHQNISIRKSEISKAERIVNAQVLKFLQWQESSREYASQLIEVPT